MVLSEEAATTPRAEPKPWPRPRWVRSKDVSGGVDIRQWTQDVDFRGKAALWSLRGREGAKLGGSEESGEVEAVKEKAGEMLGGRGSGWTVDERASAQAFLYQLRKEHSSCHLWIGRSWISGGV